MSTIDFDSEPFKDQNTADPTESEHRCGETVLVAEDDPAVMEVLTAMLKSFGYDVIEAPYGKSVVEQFLLNKDRIRIVLCDVMMPGISGAEIERAIRSEVPDMPILFMTSWAVEGGQKNRLEGKACLIAKPFTPEALLQKMRELRDEKRERSR